MRALLCILCVAAIGIGVGCAALSEYVTPASIDQKAVEYVVKAGVADANDFKGYANLEKAIRLELMVENAYEVVTLALEQMREKNQLDYSILRGVVINNTKVAREREELLFGETGLLAVGLGALGAGGLGSILGLMRKRPGDITPQELEAALADVKGEVTAKDRQVIEIVKGVQKFLDKYPKGTVYGDELRLALSNQSIDTREAVAVAKARV